MDRLDEARRLEEEARKLETAEAEKSRELFSSAAEIYNSLLAQEPDNAYLASKLLFCTKHSTTQPAEALALARQLVGRHPESHHVRNQHAWLCRSLLEEAVSQNDCSWALDLAAEALADFPHLKETGKLCTAVIHSLNRLRKQVQDLPREKQDRAEQLARFLRERGELIEQTAPNNKKEKQSCSPRELFYYLVRWVGREAGDWELVEKFIGRAVHDFPRNEWFCQAHVESALHLDKLEQACSRAETYSQRLPRARELGVACAEAYLKAGREPEAQKLLERVCRQQGNSWSWYKLARFYIGQGNMQQANQALSAGLALQDPKNPGLVWRLHYERSLVLLALGQPGPAAHEAWLAREARQNSGWGLGTALRNFLEYNEELFHDTMLELDSRPAGEVRRQALEAYRRDNNTLRQEDLLAARVKWYDENRGFGFVRLTDGREAILYGKNCRGPQPEAGREVRVRIARSFDKKKNRPGWKVEYLQYPQTPAAGQAAG